MIDYQNPEEKIRRLEPVRGEIGRALWRTVLFCFIISAVVAAFLKLN